MRSSLILLLFSTLLFSGCSLFSSDDETEPAELVKFKKTIKIKKNWSRKVGFQGEPEIYTRLLPAVDGDVIYAADVEGRVTAIDKKKGKKIWRVKTKEPLSSAVGAGNGAVFVGTLDGIVLSLSQQDGNDSMLHAILYQSLAGTKAVAFPLHQALHPLTPKVSHS